MARNAIVFGATSGIGKALSELLVQDGYKVMITGRRLERLESLKATSPDSYVIRQHDITDIEDTGKLFEEVPSSLGQVDLIIHNSGIGENNFDLKWDKDLPTLNTNVIGAARVYQLAYNFFKVQGHGHLVGTAEPGFDRHLLKKKFPHFYSSPLTSIVVAGLIP